MKKEFNFSQISYEYIKHESSLPFKIFFTSMGYRGFHWHKDFELLLILKGDVTLVTRDKTYHLSKGDLYITNPNEFHGLLQGSEKNLFLVLQIDPDLSNPYHQNLHMIKFNLPSDLDKKTSKYRQICSSCAQIIVEAFEKKEGFDYICMAEVNRIIGLLVRDFSKKIEKNDENKVNIYRISRITKMLDFMNQNCKNNISLKDLADEVKLSSFYVSHLIKEYTGYSFQKNIGLIRTHHAIKLMMNSSDTLIDIAMEAGFSDIRYFNKYFKEIFSMTPSELRRRENWQNIIFNEMSGVKEDIKNLIPELQEYLSDTHMPQ
jgi:xylan 1,4-beta-xylosidase